MLKSICFWDLEFPSRDGESMKIAKPVTPQSESVSEEDSDPEQAQRDKDMQKNLALLAKYFKKLYKPTNNNLRTSSNSRNKTEDTTPRKPKHVKDYSYHKEKMMMCKQAEQGVPLQAEQADWLADTDEEIDEQELEAHYSFMAKIQEVLPEESSSTEQPLEQVDQNAAECVDERAALANLIANLTLDTEENKTILKQLKKANASLTQELEECKTNLDETSRALGEATSCRDSCLIALQNKQNEFEKYKAFNDRTIDYDILQTKLNETLGLLALKDIEIKEGLPKLKYVKDQLCSSCEMSKAKRSSFKSKAVPSSKWKAKLLLTGLDHLDSLPFYTIKMKTPEVLKDFLTMIQRNLQAQVISVRTDRGTKFLNKTLHAYFKEEGIEHQTSTPRTPEQNGVVERRNRTLVEAARTMLSASKLPLLFWMKQLQTAMLYFRQINSSSSILWKDGVSHH
ncbi:retrovirus-related pol polyprotein from transposon TNT 1-94 [Tanacetum coccineum]